MEVRKVNNSDFVADDSRNVEGYAVVFESPSEDLGWTEVIHRGAITEETINKSDIFVRFNHKEDKVLARSKFGKGSLILEVDDKGVKYAFEAPNTALGDELLEYLKRGDITSSSFAFSINKEDKGAERWHKVGETLYRDIYKIDRLYDVAPVFCPAYEATSCSARYEEVKATSNEIDCKMDVIRKEVEEL